MQRKRLKLTSRQFQNHVHEVNIHGSSMLSLLEYQKHKLWKMIKMFINVNLSVYQKYYTGDEPLSYS